MSELLTIKKYADRCGITYEAARRLVERHSETLGENIVVIGKIRYLNEKAVELLDDQRDKRKISVEDTESELMRSEIKDLREKNEILTAENAALKERVILLQDMALRDKEKLVELSDRISDRLLTVSDQDPAAVQQIESKPDQEEKTEDPEQPKHWWEKLTSWIR